MKSQGDLFYGSDYDYDYDYDAAGYTYPIIFRPFAGGGLFPGTQLPVVSVAPVAGVSYMRSIPEQHGYILDGESEEPSQPQTVPVSDDTDKTAKPAVQSGTVSEVAVEPEVTVSVPASGQTQGVPEDLKLRQRYMESRFKDDAVSEAGARGAFQIMPANVKAYVEATGDEGDPMDPEYSERMRDWLWDQIMRSDTINNGNPSDIVRYAKALAAYNWGVGNLGRYLEKRKNAGEDIYGSTDWIAGIPEQPRDYVNFILFNQDSKHGNAKEYESLLAKFNARQNGGKISRYVRDADSAALDRIEVLARGILNSRK